MRNILYIFGKFSDQDIDWLREAGTREDLAAGHVLIQQGHPVESIYVTLSGSFEVARGPRKIAVLGPGEIIGELSFLDSRPPAATVRALEPSVVLSFSMKRVRTKLRLDTGFASRFYLALASMLADRTRSTLQKFDAKQSASLERDIEATDEIPPDLLNDANLAATRFDRMRRAFLEA